MNINEIKFINIFLATLIVELIILIFFRFTKSVFTGQAANDWYDKLRWSAIILDLLSVMIGFYLNIFLNKYLKLNNYYYLFLFQILIQVIHDILFYFFVILKSKKGNSMVMDELKSYSSKISYGAIIGDSWMYSMGIPILVISLNYSSEKLIFTSLVCLYLIGYLVYQKPLYKYSSNYLEYLIPILLNLNFFKNN